LEALHAARSAESAGDRLAINYCVCLPRQQSLFSSSHAWRRVAEHPLPGRVHVAEVHALAVIVAVNYRELSSCDALSERRHQACQ
jgi:hypothetical protein